MASPAGLLEQARAAVQAAGDLAALDTVRVRYLGRKGLITAELKGLGRLPVEERASAGREINRVKQAVIDRIVGDVDALKSHGIGAVAIMPNDTEAYPADSFENMKLFGAQHGFGFPYLIDPTQEVARAYDAACTPDFFGFDHGLSLQYRGRLDASRMEPVPDARRELLEAMIQVAETGRGPEEQLPSMGCSIKWREAA